MRRHCALLAIPILLAAAPPAGADEPWEAQSESFRCLNDTGPTAFYHGDSASKAYDARFKLGHGIPQAMLDGYVPQGLGTWAGWGGPGNDLLLQSAYNDDTHRAVVVGMVPGGGATQMPVLVRPGRKGFVDAHVGGVAVAGSWMYVSGPTVDGLPTVLKFDLPAVRAALANGGELKARAEIKLDVGTAGFAASFLAAEGNSLWVGTFDDDSRNRMYRFSLGPKGGLRRIGGPGNWRQIPKKTQGLAVTPQHFLFSTSYGSKNRSNVYVVRRGQKLLDRAYPQDLVCFAAPSMSQGMTLSGGQAFLSFESGSFRYRTDPCDKPVLEGDCTRNVITHVHRAAVNRLTAMT